MMTRHVRIKPEWRDDPADDTVYVIAEDNGDRLLIRPVYWPHGDIAPIELVRREMVTFCKV